MRNKKVLSTVVASALVATTMAMPAMAAESGNLNVDVSTKTGVLRVQVPTKMAMEIDQFEIAQTGSQIASGEFDMTNLSEMNVRVGITSTATLASGIDLVSGKEAAEESTGDEAWLAVAAKTASSSYDDAATDDTENYWDLTEANANVATFASDTKKAEQTFYLEKATGNTVYKLAVPDADEQVDKTFAQFYELTAIGTQPTDDDELQAAVDVSDVYVVVTADAGNDGEAVTKIGKGTAVASGTFAGTNTYYTAADTTSTPASGKLYVYASKGTAGGAAGFRYVGKLSNAKESWTKEDITAVGITYTITGLTASNYDEVKDDCTYGLYTPVTGPQISMNAAGLITVSGLTSDRNYTGMTIVDEDGMTKTQADSNITWNLSNWDRTNGGTFTAQIPNGWVTYWSGKEVTVTVSLTDSTNISTTVTL